MLCGCTDDEQITHNILISEYKGKTDSINVDYLERWSAPNAQLMISSDDYTVLVSQDDSVKIYVALNREKNFEEIRDIHGSGPGKLLSVYSLSHEFGNTINIYDGITKRINKVDIERLMSNVGRNNSDYKESFVYINKLSIDGLVFDVKGRNNNWYATGLMPDSRIKYIEGSTETNVESLLRNNKLQSETVFNHSMHSVISLHPKFNRLAVATKYSDIIEIYKDIESDTLISIVDNSLPVFHVDSIGSPTGRFMMSGETVLGHEAITSDNTYIYTLYSGYHVYEEQVYTRLNIIDWSGNIVNTYILNTKAFDISSYGDTILILTQDILSQSETNASTYIYSISKSRLIG